MKAKQRITIEQLDMKLAEYRKLPWRPSRGWIHTIRTTLGMSHRQLANRLGIKAPSVVEIENREKNGAITIRNLKDAARGLNMRVVYCLVPIEGSLELLVARKAEEMARKIVLTANTMKPVNKRKLEKSIKKLALEIREEMPRYLWDPV